MLTINYSLNGSPKDANPFDVVRGLGMSILNYESCTIADCIFMLVENEPQGSQGFPDFITISNKELKLPNGAY